MKTFYNVRGIWTANTTREPLPCELWAPRADFETAKRDALSAAARHGREFAVVECKRIGVAGPVVLEMEWTPDIAPRKARKAKRGRKSTRK